MSVWIKICGVTSSDDALRAVEAGADAVGVNLVPSSPRAVDEATARSIVEAVGSDAEVFDAFGFTLSATRPSPAA